MLLRHLAKTVALPAAHSVGLLRLVAALGRAPSAALMWHNVRGDVFERHARFLADRCDVLSLDEFLAARGEPAKRPRVTLTFDDGYATFAREIAPILAARRMPAAWFVTTGHVGATAPHWFDRVGAAIDASARRGIALDGRSWRLASWNRPYAAVEVKSAMKRAAPAERDRMIAEILAQTGEPPRAALDACRTASLDELRGVDARLVEVGSHSATHPMLTSCDDAALDAELRGSRERLEAWLGRGVRHFAYPSGDHDARIVEAVRRAGYSSAWTTQPRFVAATDDAFEMPRVSIDERASVAVLAAKLLPRGAAVSR